MSRLLGQIGTIDWCRRTKGLMTAAERRRFTAAVMVETARSLPRLLLARAGVWGDGPDPSSFALPDTAYARSVIDASAWLSPMIMAHSLRSYLFARALAAAEGEQVDDDALFTATMLHDWAFPKLEDPADDRCFGLRGAELATEFLQASPLSASQRHDVLDAITLHLNPYVLRQQGSLQRLAHDGIVLDVAGVRAWELDRAGIARVLSNHPRHGFLSHGPERFHAHAARVPNARAAQLMRCGLRFAMRLGPLYEADPRTPRLAASQGGSQPAGSEAQIAQDGPP